MNVTLYRNRHRASPFAEFDRVANRLNQVFGEYFPELGGDGIAWRPAVNVEETKDELIVTAELPGLTSQDVDVEVANGVLTLRGRKEEEKEESEDRRYHLWERRYGSFARSFTLPVGVQQEGIEAEFQDGILRVRLPKAQEAKGRKIEVKVAAPRN